MQTTIEVDIDAPLDVVWTILDDERNLPRWVPEVVETTFPDGHDRANPVGVRFRQKIREAGRVKEYGGVVTAYEPRKRLGIRMQDASFDMNLLYTLAQEGSGTRLVYELEVVLKSLFARIMGLLARPLTKRIVGRQLAALKRIAEEDAKVRACKA
jgi:uncharacterized protein YndB with AHSA1/START domain